MQAASIKEPSQNTHDTLLKPDGFRINLYTLLLVTLAINVLSLALPVMTLQVYDRILPNHGAGTLSILIVGVVVALSLETLLKLGRAYMIGWAGASYEHQLSARMMKSILDADLTRIPRYGTSEYMQRMSAAARLKNFFNGHSATVLFELIFLPVFLGLVWYIAGALVAIPLLILCTFTITSFVRGRRLKTLLKDRELHDDKRFNFLIETLEGVHTLKAFALEHLFERRYEEMEKRSTLSNYNVTLHTASLYNTGAVFSQIMMASVITAGAVLVLNGQITTGALIAVLLLSGRMMQPVQRVLGLWTQYQDYTLSRDIVTELLETPIHKTNPDESPSLAEGKLEARHIDFRPSETGPWVVQDMNLSLQKGEIILIDGAQGSGKTALLKMLAGIYPPASGALIIDGRPIENYPAHILNKHIAYVRTDGLIFRGTIRDNITCFKQHTEKNAREIAALLKVDRDVARMPSGYDTFLSGNGTDTIPPGLKQRISMVRALAGKPKIILYDNADRCLDREGYELVYNLFSILKSKATFVLVSDDQNIRSFAEKRYVLENGELREEADLNISASKASPYKELLF